MKPLPCLAAALMLALPAAAIAATPVKVTRFHKGTPIAPGSVLIEMAPDATVTPGPEAATYLDAIAAAMASAGFTRATDNGPADYRVIVSVARSVEELPPAPPPLQIGLGGGGGSGGVGVGGSVAFGVGKRQPRSQVTTQLSARLFGSGDTAIWEGRAVHSVEERGKLVQPAAEAEKLSQALFKGFPGQSGRTISVK